ncbi:hypothetical protein [Methylobacterium sp. E-066]|uniref:hypothetical protein n=1 Tax=Methylobacterium sp. E-066 TaxID=2836584 RepID=UPI001FBB46A5|nr:hypothetical protein [Methylobacterium sp. E-066]MCJ2139499.1 hypothetical protein [Methylobacterium sp. E-066]
MKAFTQGAADPVTAQAKFFLQENPQLTQALQNAGSAEEANRLMAQAWKFAGFDRPGGENAARLATTQAYANSFANGQALPATASPRGASMGATAQRGAFGLGGVQAQGSAVPGQVSQVSGVAALSGQPLALTPDATGFSSDPANPPQQPRPYDGVASALKSIAGGGQKQAQAARGGGMPAGEAPGGRPISLIEARKLYGPSKFFTMLQQHGVRARG